MSKKVALIMSKMPEGCDECPCCTQICLELYCCAKRKCIERRDASHYRPKWCPLHELPEKYPDALMDEWTDGYNSCLKNILGE